ncbi:MAG: ABC transporter permease [Desulfobacterales bacterium]|jgi:ABC-type polysaccharide/polyol phosphate export permease
MAENLTFIIKRRNLLYQMVASDLKAGAKDMMLGYLWWVLDPILLMLIFWILIGMIFQRGGPDFPLFVLCGLFPHRAFTVSFSKSVNSLVSAFGVISQIHFPRIYLALKGVISNHFKLLFGFIVLILVSIIYEKPLGPHLFLLIVPYSIQVVLISGVAMMMSVLGVYFRDLQNLSQFVARILMYMSPILYSVERIPERFRDIYMLNPLASLYVTYRSIIMQTPINLQYVFIAATQALVVFLTGYLIFAKTEKSLLKYV